GRPGGEVAEVLIRTHRMHRVAEAGVIALGNPYAVPAEGGEPHSGAAAAGGTPHAPGGHAAGSQDPADGERADPTRPGWLCRLLDWQRAAPDPDTFWTSLRDELAEDQEITVFRADGAAVGLPAGASCVDAAYGLHGEDAHACIGARVNGRLATLATVLSDGDTVQLLMAHETGAGPSPEWLEHARTPAARIAISRWLNAHRDETGPPAAAQPPA
ncbi:TGS domain-containing protein, partial [Streptomyces sp. URMC 123]|uniref:TGS domain-containing protein n=1 Tax=Streptomyces sp. URMC 123 TaxID=3423403 RepID=UPI003F1C995E